MLSRLHTRSVSILLTALAFGITATRAGADSFVNKRPTFRLESTKAFPGSTARLGLYVSNGVADTKAVNFTIRITGGADSVNGRLTGSSTYPGFDENMPEATEYRGLVDLPDGQEINTEGPETRIATIEVPIKQNVANGAPPIQLAVVTKFDAEGIVGLTGMSDSAGLSVHGEDEDPIPGGDRQIQGSTATIGILDTGTTIDLCPLNAYPDEWEFVQFPLSPPLTSTGHFLGEFHPGEGFSVTLKDNNAIGSFQNRDTDATIIPSPGNGKVLHVLWTIGSISASAYDLPTIRLRTSARDASFTQEHIFKESSSTNNPPVFMPVSNDQGPRNFESVFYCPDSLTNSNPSVASNGILLAFDVLQFQWPLNSTSNGAIDSRLDLKKITYSSFDPGTLGTGTVIFTISSFATGDSQGFVPYENKNIDICLTGGLLSSDLKIEGGLTISPPSLQFQQPSQCNPSALGYDFSFGFWEKTFNGTATNESWIVAADTLYKIEFTLSSTAPSGTKSHPARLRFTAGDDDFTGTAIVNGIQDTGFDPRGGDKLYTAFLRFPPATVGLPVKVDYDVYCANAATRGAITLKDLKVTALNLTSADQFGSACPSPSP